MTPHLTRRNLGPTLDPPETMETMTGLSKKTIKVVVVMMVVMMMATTTVVVVVVVVVVTTMMILHKVREHRTPMPF